MYVAKRIRVASVAGNAVTFYSLQKLVNLVWPAECVLSTTRDCQWLLGVCITCLDR